MSWIAECPICGEWTTEPRPERDEIMCQCGFYAPAKHWNAIWRRRVKGPVDCYSCEVHFNDYIDKLVSKLIGDAP